MTVGTRQSASATTASERDDNAIMNRLIVGMTLSALLLVGIGVWAARASLSGAIIAPGQVVVDSSVKKVQHQSGGIVKAINVKNGDRVDAGQVVVLLDDTQSRASLGIVVAEQVRLISRRARLEAERDGAASVTLPVGFEAMLADAPAIAAGEVNIFISRRDGRASQKQQLEERIGQLRQEIVGLEAQRKAKTTEIALMRDELERVSAMRKKNLVPVQRELATQRDVARLEGEDGLLAAQIAKAGGQISEIGLQLISVDQDALTETVKELREVESRIAELIERRIAAVDMLNRIEIRAPYTGLVHELAVHSVGGVVGPGETVMSIVPESEALAIEVHVQPTDIDQIAIGQKTTLRFSAFNQRTTPELTGSILRVAADATTEPQSGMRYFVARVSIPDAELLKLGHKLLPGMPVEAFVETGERTALSYFTKPFTDQIARAFRED